jgi:TrmH family RNA methyltransferase
MEITEITSPTNPKIKAVVRLHQKKYRDEDGLILIEGRHPVEEAIAAGIEITEVYLRGLEPCPDGLDIEPIAVTESVMAKMATTDSPTPILAVARRPKSYTGPLWDGTHRLAMGLVILQDPGNVGTIIRSAAAFGVNTVLLIGEKGVDPYQPKVIRASAGQVFRMHLVAVSTFDELQAMLKSEGPVSVWGADAHQGDSYKAATLTDKTLLLMGSEAHGLPAVTWDFAKPLHIPMTHGIESLNVGVAGAILLAEFFQKGSFDPI